MGRAILAFFAAALIRILRRTWRVRLVGPDPGFESRKVVVCFWHGRQAGLFAHPRPVPVAVLASRSRDGSLQARILGRLGFRVLRGSSSRGGAAGLKGLVDAMREGGAAAFAVDGPRGPLHRVKPGAVLAAAEAGAVLVPMTTRASRSWLFKKSWDQYVLPKPFARVDIVRGPALDVSSDDPEARRGGLEAALLALEREGAPDDRYSSIG